MFLAYDQECWKVTKESTERVDILVCNHEEAGTPLSLHRKHAAEYRNEGINLVSDDTWFLASPTVIQLVQDKSVCQAFQIPSESPFLLHYQVSTLLLAVIQSVLSLVKKNFLH